ncbi:MULTISPECIES: GNAT family N-acetyltransferase [Olivibacter]|jgi:putative acetyltransferase|uniref:GCN5-related N-acetyltransferase n=3 Tax=Sphingobacteriaceae TaxID=84566 RepID=F4C7Y9_SPHS2|nr:MULTISPECIES: GNAT family N-acetyltransferase [Olivibacter]MCL4637965.1 GNAT family N-acetyltransferase [Olivibacter sp. UJ_SKK_5.1]MDM8174361.1 GNAT family N-acetyltransferase [Olivibacter sp. 47]MDX3916826.1 GNAT family N-acetyltransferase [Pseudosphingobacterium sp.]QEL04175.1 GNAT family N-acetyltransferase [Olivibacter sp. LS-1]
MSIVIRTIRQNDNQILAQILRTSLEEHHIPKEGTVYTDPTTDNLYTLFQQPRSIYYVVEEDGEVLGGCGIYPTANLPTGYAELVKLYLSNKSRGKGLGKTLINRCLEKAVDLGYTHLYLESFPQFETAISMYKKMGFSSLPHALGNSGHYACNVWMVKELVLAAN